MIAVLLVAGFVVTSLRPASATPGWKCPTDGYNYSCVHWDCGQVHWNTPDGNGGTIKNQGWAVSTRWDMHTCNLGWGNCNNAGSYLCARVAVWDNTPCRAPNQIVANFESVSVGCDTTDTADDPNVPNLDWNVGVGN